MCRPGLHGEMNLLTGRPDIVYVRPVLDETGQTVRLLYHYDRPGFPTEGRSNINPDVHPELLPPSGLDEKESHWFVSAFWKLVDSMFYGFDGTWMVVLLIKLLIKQIMMMITTMMILMMVITDVLMLIKWFSICQGWIHW